MQYLRHVYYLLRYFESSMNYTVRPRLGDKVPVVVYQYSRSDQRCTSILMELESTGPHLHKLQGCTQDWRLQPRRHIIFWFFS